MNSTRQMSDWMQDSKALISCTQDCTSLSIALRSWLTRYVTIQRDAAISADEEASA
jgi:hypothetical protein